MDIYFKKKYFTGCLLIKKKLFGIGFLIDCTPAIFDIEHLATISIDFFIIRGWINIYKKTKKYEKININRQ